MYIVKILMNNYQYYYCIIREFFFIYFNLTTFVKDAKIKNLINTRIYLVKQCGFFQKKIADLRNNCDIAEQLRTCGMITDLRNNCGLAEQLRNYGMISILRNNCDIAE